MSDDSPDGVDGQFRALVRLQAYFSRLQAYFSGKHALTLRVVEPVVYL